MRNPEPKEEKMENKPEPRIYVACLAAYNNGILHGAWIDAHQEAWTIYDAIRAMLDTSPISDAEEWAIHDYEGFEGVTIAEYAGIASVAEIAAFIVEHGRLGAELLCYFSDIEEAREAIEDRYAGEYSSLADFAEELTEGSISISEPLRFYIDYDRMARDMAISDIITFETGVEHVHVFWSH
jgi:antirestriction protein